MKSCFAVILNSSSLLPQAVPSMLLSELSAAKTMNLS